MNEPDLLLYWQSAAQPDDVLSPDARPLGAFEPEKIFLLDVNAPHTGRLVLYSGAHHSIVDESLIEKLP